MITSLSKILSPKGQVTPVFIAVALLFFSFLSFKVHTLVSLQSFIFVLFGIFFFGLAFFKTNFALGILIFSMLLSPEIGVGRLADRAVTIRIEDLLLIVIFIGWFAKMAVYKELGLLRRTPLNQPILLYVLACVISTAFALIEGRVVWQRSFFYFLKYFEYFLLYFLVVNNIHNAKQAKTFIFLLIMTCLIVSIAGLLSYHGAGERATAPFEKEGEPNTLAGYLVLLIPIMLNILFYSKSSRFKIFLGATLVCAFLTLVFTLSRGGWISFIVMFLVLVFIIPKYKSVLVAGLVVAVVFGPILAPKAVYQRVTETFAKGGKTYTVGRRALVIDESAAARIDSWKIGFGKLVQKPVFGFGIPGGAVIDNQYTRVMIETGLVGFSAFLYLLVMIGRTIYFSIITVRGGWMAQGLAVGFMAAFFGLLVHCFSSATFILIRIMEPFWFIMAIVVLLPDFVKPVEKEVSIQGT